MTSHGKTRRVLGRLMNGDTGKNQCEDDFFGKCFFLYINNASNVLNMQQKIKNEISM